MPNIFSSDGLRPCPICHAAGRVGWRLLYENRLDLPDGWMLPDYYDVVECLYCGMVFANTTATQADYNRYYTTMYQEAGGFAGSNSYDRQRLDKLAEALAKYPANFSILDIGSGAGYLAEQLRHMGYRHVMTVDPFAPADFRVTLDDMSSVPHHDVAILSHVLEHIIDLSTALENLARVASYVVIEVPNFDRANLEKQRPFWEFSLHHVNYFTVDTLAMLLRRHGFRVQACTTHMVDIPVIRCFAVSNAASKPMDYIHMSQRVMDKWIKQLDAIGKPIIVYGLGEVAMRVLRVSKVVVSGVIDENPMYNGRTWRRMPIMTEPVNDDPIVIISTRFADHIEQKIKSRGWTNEIIRLRD